MSLERQGWIALSSPPATAVPATKSAGVTTVMAAPRTCAAIAAAFSDEVRIKPPPRRLNRSSWLDQNRAGSCLPEGTGMTDGTQPAQSAPRKPSIRSAHSGMNRMITSPGRAPRARNAVAQRRAAVFSAMFVSVRALSRP